MELGAINECLQRKSMVKRKRSRKVYFDPKTAPIKPSDDSATMNSNNNNDINKELENNSSYSSTTSISRIKEEEKPKVKWKQKDKVSFKSNNEEWADIDNLINEFRKEKEVSKSRGAKIKMDFKSFLEENFKFKSKKRWRKRKTTKHVNFKQSNNRLTVFQPVRLNSSLATRNLNLLDTCDEEYKVERGTRRRYLHSSMEAKNCSLSPAVNFPSYSVTNNSIDAIKCRNVVETSMRLASPSGLIEYKIKVPGSNLTQGSTSVLESMKKDNKFYTQLMKQRNPHKQKSKFTPLSPSAPNKFERLLSFETACKPLECRLQKLSTQLERALPGVNELNKSTKWQNNDVSHLKSPMGNSKRNIKFKYSNGAVSTACDTQAYHTEKQSNVRFHRRNYPQVPQSISRVSKSIAVDEIDEFRKLHWTSY